MANADLSSAPYVLRRNASDDGGFGLRAALVRPKYTRLNAGQLVRTVLLIVVSLGCLQIAPAASQAPKGGVARPGSQKPL